MPMHKIRSFSVFLSSRLGLVEVKVELELEMEVEVKCAVVRAPSFFGVPFWLYKSGEGALLEPVSSERNV
eukprot:4760463-Prorocentrum_lima.AAC.1